MRTKTATREETFLELLAHKTVRMLPTYNATAEYAKYTKSIVSSEHLYNISFSNHRGKYTISLWIEKLSLVDRLHVEVNEILFGDKVETTVVLTNYSIPIKDLSEEGLSDGVILACLESNVYKIKRALDGKEIYW